MADGTTFGAFIREKRINAEPSISLRKMAELLNLSPVYMSDIETGREYAPKSEVLTNLTRILKLNKSEQDEMYELAAKTKLNDPVPADLPDYISSNEYARIALRMARDVDATDTEWQEFIEKLKRRSEHQEDE